MDSDDGLQLNISGFDVPVGKTDRKAKTNRHTASFRKQQKVSQQVSACCDLLTEALQALRNKTRTCTETEGCAETRSKTRKRSRSSESCSGASIRQRPERL